MIKEGFFIRVKNISIIEMITALGGNDYMKVSVLKPVFAEDASKLVNTIGVFPETILLKKEHWVVDAKSLLGVLALGLQPGEELEVSGIESEDAEQAILGLGIFEKK